MSEYSYNQRKGAGMDSPSGYWQGDYDGDDLVTEDDEVEEAEDDKPTDSTIEED